MPKEVRISMLSPFEEGHWEGAEIEPPAEAEIIFN